MEILLDKKTNINTIYNTVYGKNNEQVESAAKPIVKL